MRSVPCEISPDVSHECFGGYPLTLVAVYSRVCSLLPCYRLSCWQFLYRIHLSFTSLIFIIRVQFAVPISSKGTHLSFIPLIISVYRTRMVNSALKCQIIILITARSFYNYNIILIIIQYP